MAEATRMKNYISDNAGPDLAFIFNDVELDLKVQYDLVHAGYKSVRRIAAMEDAPAGAREAFKTILGIDPTVGPQERLTLTILVDVWNICKVSAAKDMEAKAEAAVSGSVKLVSANDRNLMRKVLQKSEDDKLPDTEVPSAEYLTLKIDEVEQNDPKASPLDEISHLEHATDIDLAIGMDPKGTFRTMRRKVKVDTPNDPEAYRRRMRVEQNLWLMIAAKFLNKPWLEKLTARHFERFVDYILGDTVCGIHNEEPSRVPPQWSLVLSYEYKLRKEAFKLVRDGEQSLPHALLAVTKNPELRTTHFVEKLLVSPGRAASSHSSTTLPVPPAAPPARPPRPAVHNFSLKRPNPGVAGEHQAKGNGMHGSRGKQTKSRKKIDPSLPLTDITPDGQDICFKYNVKACKGGCGRDHRCRVKGCTHRGPACEHPHDE